MSAADTLAKVGGGVKNLAVGVGVILGLYVAWKVLEYLKNNKEDYDPTSGKNLVYRGANAVVSTLRDDPHATVGTTAFDIVDTIKGWIPGLQSEDEKRAAAERAQCELIYPKGSGKRPPANSPCYKILGRDWNK